MWFAWHSGCQVTGALVLVAFFRSRHVGHHGALQTPSGLHLHSYHEQLSNKRNIMPTHMLCTSSQVLYEAAFSQNRLYRQTMFKWNKGLCLKKKKKILKNFCHEPRNSGNPVGLFCWVCTVSKFKINCSFEHFWLIYSMMHNVSHVRYLDV